MKVADLEIVVSLKGASDVGTGLRHVDSGLENVKSMALETKAAILGVIYGLEQMAAQSLQTGASLQTFGNLTGLDPKTLQQWQYALQQSFVDANKTTSAVVALQQKMSEVIVQGTGITGMQPVFEAAGIDEKRIRDTFYVLGKLREYAQAHKATPDITRNLMGNLLPQEVIQALMTGNFDPKKTPRFQFYSDGQTNALANDARTLKNLQTKIEHFFGALTAEHGGQFISDISKLTNALIQMSLALDKLGNSLGAWKALHDAVSALSSFVNPSQGSEFKGLPKSEVEAIKARRQGIDNFFETTLPKLLSGVVDQFKTLPSGGVIHNTHHSTLHAHGMGAEEVKKLVDDHHKKVISTPFRDINSVAGKQNN